MSNTKMEELKAQIEEHRYEIDTLKDGFGKLVSSIEKMTESVNELIVQFAVTSQKHDANAKNIEKLEAEQKEHSKMLADHHPTVISVRGLMWKIMGAIILGMGGFTSIVVGILKMN